MEEAEGQVRGEGFSALSRGTTLPALSSFTNLEANEINYYFFLKRT
jgi:hypothetical protein